MTFTVPNGPDAATVDQTEPDALDYEILGYGPTGVISGCDVTAQVSPNMSVAVAAGRAVVDGVPVEVPSGNVTIQTADATARFDMIVVDSGGFKSAVRGTASASNPVFPVVDLSSYAVLAAVYVGPSISNIASQAVVDKRVIMPVDLRRTYDSADDVVLESNVAGDTFRVSAGGKLSWVSSVLQRIADQAMELTSGLSIKSTSPLSSLLTLTGRAGTPDQQKVLDVRDSGGSTVASISGTGVFQAANFVAGSGPPYGTVADKGTLYIDLTTPRNRTLWVSEGAGQWDPFRSYDPSDDEVPVGAMMPYFGAVAPVGWLLMNGDTISDTDPETADIAAVVGKGYGPAADGFTVLPDFRGLIPIGAGGDVALTLGQVAGTKEITIELENLPAHDHPVNDPGHRHPTAGRPVYAPPTGTLRPDTDANVTPFALAVEPTDTDTTGTTGITVGEAGGGEPLSTLPPVGTVNWIAKAHATYARISQFSGETLIPVDESGTTVYMTISEFQTALGL